MKAIKERELESEFQVKNVELERKQEEIKKEAAEEVKKKRDKLKNKIADMRKKSQRSESKLKQKLLNMRMKIAGQMRDAYRSGDCDKCKKAVESPQLRLAYCQASFNEDITKFEECKEDYENFNNICAENEFGDMNIGERNKCNTVIEKAIEEHKVSGRWIWQEPINDSEEPSASG